MRTTLDIEKPVLDALKALQRKEKRSLSKIASSLLSEALAQHESTYSKTRASKLDWATSDMGARVDISDKDAFYKALDDS